MNMIGYHYDNHMLNLLVDEVFAGLDDLAPSLRIGYLSTTDTSQYRFYPQHPLESIGYEPGIVYLGTKSLVEHSKDDKYRDDDVVRIVQSACHERCHILLDNKYFRQANLGEKSEVLFDAAKISLAASFCDEYMHSGYWTNTNEMLCETYSLRYFRRIFAEAFEYDGVDWENILVKRESSLNFSRCQEFLTLDDVIEQYEKMLPLLKYQNKVGEYLNHVDYESEHLRVLKSSGTLKKMFMAASGVEEVDIINTYIAANNPEYLRGYACLWETYPSKNFKNRVEQAKRLLLGIHDQDNLSDDDMLEY